MQSLLYSKGGGQHHLPLADSEAGRGMGKLCSKDRKALGVHSLELVTQGSWRRVNWKQGISCYWLGVCIRFSELFSPELEAGAKIREVGNQ